MRIDILYIDGCPNYLPAVERLRAVLRQEGVAAEVYEIRVKDELAAKALSFFGSPTLRTKKRSRCRTRRGERVRFARIPWKR